MHSKSRQNRQNLTHVRHACQGAADYIDNACGDSPPPPGSLRWGAALETCVRGCPRRRPKSSENRTRKLQNEVPGASGVSFLRSQGDVLRSPVPCCMRWALRATSGGAPEASRGRSRGARGALGDLSGASGDGPGTPDSDLFGFGSDFGDALGGGMENGRFFGCFGLDFSSFSGGLFACVCPSFGHTRQLAGQQRHPRI